MLPNSVEEDYDYLFKIVIIGDSGAGKTNILSQYTKNEFFEDSKPTIGVEFATKTICLENNQQIKCQYWDTAGQERYRSITSAYYRGSVGALIVYDVTRRQSFESVQRWWEELKLHSTEDIVVLLVGNKIDLESQRVCTTFDGQELANKLNMGFIETSALKRKNIEETFCELSKLIFNKLCGKEQEFEGIIDENVQIVNTANDSIEKKKKKSGCC